MLVCDVNCFKTFDYTLFSSLSLTFYFEEWVITLSLGYSPPATTRFSSEFGAREHLRGIIQHRSQTEVEDRVEYLMMLFDVWYKLEKWNEMFDRMILSTSSSWRVWSWRNRNWPARGRRSRCCPRHKTPGFQTGRTGSSSSPTCAPTFGWS